MEIGANSSPRTHLVIFDGDDTLWRTQELYDAIKAKFTLLIAQEGIVAKDALDLLERIDAEAVEVGGFTVDRFVQSMLRTYRALKGPTILDRSDSVDKAIQLLGQSLFSDYDLYPDARPVLNELKYRFRLVLATKGQADIQRRKIDSLGLEPYFDAIYVLERKTKAEYLHILAESHVSAHDAWAVGNSARSDVNPALALGMRAILVKRPGWSYEDAERTSSEAIVVDSLVAACKAILRRDHQESSRFAINRH